MAARPHKWSRQQYQWLLDHSAGRPRKETCSEFRQVFGLQISDDRIIGAMKRIGAKCGLDTTFQKGCESHNKGKKMSPEIYEKVKGTMFKAGNVPSNTDPIGTEKILADGYVWVKIADQPKVRKSDNWKQKQRLIYEQLHGPIPDNVKVIFLDGNNRNFDPDNLAPVTNRELLEMNRNGFRTKDPELTKAAINLVKLIVRTRHRELEVHANEKS